VSLPDLGPDGIGVYVHFPWCLKKCPYCDFLSVAVPTEAAGETASVEYARKTLPHERYADAIVRELEARTQKAWPEDSEEPRPALKSVFFGGGTPSLWSPRALGRCLSAIKAQFPSQPSGEELEVTVECNPSSVTEKHFEELLEAGVNRVSIGVQALDNERLGFLGRWHDESAALAALRAAAKVGVPRVSGDLIFGVFKQSPQDAVRDVSLVAETGVTHLSAYSLTIEPGTRFGALDSKGKLPLLDDALVAESFHGVDAALSSLGFEHYEISNYARPGHESRHNLGYWLGRDYLGLGTGAYGTLALSESRLRYRNILSPERYLDTWTGPVEFEPYESKLASRELLSPEEALQEAVLLGLRVRAGVDLDEIARYRGAKGVGEERAEAISSLIQDKKLLRKGPRLSLAPQEWIFADRTIRELI